MANKGGQSLLFDVQIVHKTPKVNFLWRSAGDHVDTFQRATCFQ